MPETEIKKKQKLPSKNAIKEKVKWHHNELRILQEKWKQHGEHMCQLDISIQNEIDK